MTPEEVLGVRPGAGRDELRAAYRAAARAHHPDRLVGLPEEERRAHQRQLQAANDAWRTLRDRASDTAAPAAPTGAPAEPPEPAAWWDDDDEPFGGDADATPSRAHQRLTILPVVAFGLAVGTFALSVVMSAPALWLAAGGWLALSGVLFVLVPFLVMVRGHANDPR